MKHEQSGAVLLLERYLDDPCAFAEEICGFTPSDQQAPIMRAIGLPGSRVSIRSGHGVGKTSMCSVMILWFLSLHPKDAKCICTAPTSHQLFDNLWAEVSKWRQNMPLPWRERLKITSDRMVVRGMEANCYAVARTARPENPDALQGAHATHVLVLVDEASGVNDKIFEPVEGILTTRGARIALVGNPTKTDGYFFRTHNSDRGAWSTFVLSSEKSPFVEKGYCERMAARYGKESNLYRVRVLGEFPKGDADTLIPIDWIVSSVGREILPAGERIAGQDISRFGDDFCVNLVRQGNVITHIDQWQHVDGMVTAGKVVSKFRKDKLFDRVNCDTIGLGGPVLDRLLEMGVPAMSVNVGEAYSTGDRFMRLRDELYWTCREWFEKRECAISPKIPTEMVDLLVGELSGIRYTYTSNGKIKVQGKQQFKDEGTIIFEGLKVSPNAAEALILTFAEGRVDRPRRMGQVRTRTKQTAFPW